MTVWLTARGYIAPEVSCVNCWLIGTFLYFSSSAVSPCWVNFNAWTLCSMIYCFSGPFIFLYFTNHFLMKVFLLLRPMLCCSNQFGTNKEYRVSVYLQEALDTLYWCMLLFVGLWQQISSLLSSARLVHSVWWLSIFEHGHNHTPTKNWPFDFLQLNLFNVLSCNKICILPV